MEHVRISVPQRGIWFNEQLSDLGAVHHMPFAVRFAGPVDVPALGRACARMVDRHPLLRAAVRQSDGVPYLVEGAPVRVELGSDPRTEILRPFDLEKGPLARFSLLEDGRLLVIVHHLAFDGQSTDIFVADLAACYRAETAGFAPELAELGPGEHPEVEAARIAAGTPAARAYWSGRWAEPDEVVLPGFERSGQEVQPGDAVEFRLPSSVLENAAARLGVTRFETVVASVHALLRRYGNHRPVTALDLGVRPAEARGRIGVYVNELPFASEPAREMGFAEFARSVRAGLRELYQVREVPLSRAVSGVRPGVSLAPVSLTYRRRIAPPPGTTVDWVLFNHTARNALRIHLVDGPDGLGVMLQFAPGSIARTDVERIASHWQSILTQITKNPDIRVRELVLSDRLAGESFTEAVVGGSAPVNLAVGGGVAGGSAFAIVPAVEGGSKSAIVAEVVGSSASAIAGGVVGGSAPTVEGAVEDVSKLAVVSAVESGSALALEGAVVGGPPSAMAGAAMVATASAVAGGSVSAMTGAVVEYPQVGALELFLEQVAATPDAVAVVSGDVRLSYVDLDRLAGRLAGRLRDAGVEAGDLVALAAGRSERMVAGVLACWKAGAAYLPLDPAYPAERLDYILADSGAKVLLADPGTWLAGATVVPLADVPDDESTSAQGSGSGSGSAERGSAGVLAYVIYTSGSTGRPKGVEIEHRALVNLLLSMRDELRAGSGDVWLAVTSWSFDISALELWLPLVTGGSVVIAGEGETADGDALTRLAGRHAVTHVQATPSTWRMLLDAGFRFDGTVLTGGEALPLPLAARLRPRVGRLLNMYGPTETTIWSTLAEIPLNPEHVRIGRPIANTQVFVLDDDLDPVPAGIPGELYIAGAGLARGYLNRPELTAERFRSEPVRMYRTGDRVRLRGDGLEFLGRTDNQVKLRGHRIELGEIEACLLAHVKEAAVVVQDEELIAYTVGGGPDLRRHLARQVPAYMVPAAFVELGSMPLTPNGKLDRAALPRHDEPAAAVSASESPLEAVAEIWADVFGMEGIGPEESLFDLGGHSLTIAQIAARIRDRFDVDVPFYTFFDTPTITGIAAAIGERGDRT
ncbi:hypothetical protein Aph01nite_54770 [Acrocarpospora phusangensis]|uniref:Carrier domain-containing protein n=1 Tax=Acrocarpospora phusangensis TaxID=1070424 RepID=A0A919UQR4_9ACTN|nr:non-ribosomal peptide synthetase [Acrocarpospora phusangensis]GIH27167.1 hypothetical protein Aph01nite_54770 [Acrocarpospora phusangensis]